MSNFLSLICVLFIVLLPMYCILCVVIRGKKSVIFFYVLDVVLALYGLYLLQDVLRFDLRAKTATGEIISLEYKAHGNGTFVSSGKFGSDVAIVGAHTITAVIKFQIAENEKEIIGRVAYMGEQPKHAPGEEPKYREGPRYGGMIQILYDPSDPTDTRRKEFLLRWDSTILFLTGAILFGLLIFRVSKKKIVYERRLLHMEDEGLKTNQ